MGFLMEYMVENKKDRKLICENEENNSTPLLVFERTSYRPISCEIREQTKGV